MSKFASRHILPFLAPYGEWLMIAIERRQQVAADGHEMPVRAERRACLRVAFRLPADRLP